MNDWRRLQLLVLIQAAFFVIELVTGLLLGSLTLVGDSFHVFSDLLSLAIAMVAMKLAEAQVDATYTYGKRRAEVVGALVNGLILLVLCAGLAVQAVQRFFDVSEIDNPLFLAAVGVAGLLSNILGLFVFSDGHGHGHSHGGFGHSHGGSSSSSNNNNSGHSHSHDNEHSHSHSHHDEEADIQSEEQRLLGNESTYGATSTMNVMHENHYHSRPKVTEAGNKRSLNMDGVYLHVLSDIINNVVVIVLGLFVYFAPWSWKHYADPVLCLLMACLITYSTLPLCKRVIKVLLNAAPSSINASEIREDIESLPGIANIHDLHIWQLNDEMTIATLHVTVSSPPEEFSKLNRTIHECFSGHGVTSLTIQPEFAQADGSQLRACLSYGNMSSGGLESREQTLRKNTTP